MHWFKNRVFQMTRDKPRNLFLLCLSNYTFDFDFYVLVTTLHLTLEKIEIIIFLAGSCDWKRLAVIQFLYEMEILTRVKLSEREAWINFLFFKWAPCPIWGLNSRH